MIGILPRHAHSEKFEKIKFFSNINYILNVKKGASIETYPFSFYLLPLGS